MSTPTGHHDDEPIDAPVRQLFWRLRARLVTPPDEQRTEADLDRLVRLAQERAHAAPSVYAGARPGPVATGDVRPDHPVPAHSTEPLTADAADDTVVPLRRGLAVAHTLGRVAAVAVMAVAVGVGVSSARDGNVSLDALLGRDNADDLAIESTPDTSPVAPVVPEDVPEDDGNDGSADPSDDGPTLEPVPDPPDTDATEPDDDGGSQDGAGQDGAGETDTDAGSSTDGSGSAPDPDPAPAPVPSETDEVVAAPPVEEDVEERRPAPDDLQGAGGPVPCEEENLVDCVPEDELTDGGAAEDDAATDEGDVAEDESATDGGAEDGDTTSDEPAEGEVVEVEPVDEAKTQTDSGDDQDELAARRFGGDS